MNRVVAKEQSPVVRRNQQRKKEQEQRERHRNVVQQAKAYLRGRLADVAIAIISGTIAPTADAAKAQMMEVGIANGQGLFGKEALTEAIEELRLQFHLKVIG